MGMSAQFPPSPALPLPLVSRALLTLFHLKLSLICPTPPAAGKDQLEHVLSTFLLTLLLKGHVFLRSVLLSLLKEGMG